MPNTKDAAAIVRATGPSSCLDGFIIDAVVILVVAGAGIGVWVGYHNTHKKSLAKVTNLITTAAQASKNKQYDAALQQLQQAKGQAADPQQHYAIAIRQGTVAYDK